ncbi:MAG: anti-sigma factor [Stagnimonas sp.]|nr:anti-sigma factor [Stagnimonas sp.]
MKLAQPELRSSLAAEYALGLLTGRARRRFEKLLARDRDLRAEVTFWQERFAEIPAQLSPVTPRERVWTALAREILVDDNKVRPLRPAPPPVPAAAPASGNLFLWRSWALAASVASVVLSGALWREMHRSESLLLALETFRAQPMPYVATIQFEGSEARWAVSLHPEKHLMRISLAPGSMPVDISQRDLELWMLDTGGKPHSLGVLPEQAATGAEMPLPDMPSEELRHMTLTLAVSEEPKGGSPTGLPTGKVLGAMPAARAL